MDCITPSAATKCTGCALLHFELGLVKGDLQVKAEELKILRASQVECQSMAADIQALHLLVDEQRRHMATSSGKALDPDVGVFVWLQELSEKQRVRMGEVKAQHDQQVAALHMTHAQQLAAVQMQLQAMTAQYYDVLQQYEAETAVAASKHAQVQVLEATVMEQRRHLAAGTACDPDVGLLPLVRKGFFESSEDMERRVSARVDTLTQKLRDDHAAELESLKRVGDALVASLELIRAEVDAEKLKCSRLEDDNLELVSQLRRTRDFTAEWKRKYEEKCGEYDELLLANEVRVEEENLAQKFADLVAEKVEWLHSKEMLEKARDAAMQAVRHWQQEAKKITEDLVTALASRDAFQLQLYTVAAAKQALEDEAEKVKETLAEQQKACELMKQVAALSDKFRQDTAGSAATISVDALNELLLQEDATEAKTVSKKSKHKKRSKK